jgi:hypothetical protein
LYKVPKGKWTGGYELSCSHLNIRQGYSSLTLLLQNAQDPDPFVEDPGLVTKGEPPTRRERMNA